MKKPWAKEGSDIGALGELRSRLGMDGYTFFVVMTGQGDLLDVGYQWPSSVS